MSVTSSNVASSVRLGHPAPPRADWEAVYREHVVPVYRFAYARTGNRADAEDVTSTTFMRALPYLRSDVSEGELRSYLRTTARTVIADLWRERHGVFTEEIDDDATPNPRAPEAADLDVEYVLEGLPVNYRTVLELRFLRGYSIKETAASMGISVGNAKVLQLRALRRAAATKELR
ncbi:MAG: sigma-70 family RNA polymerase sigma factor [Candidatus Dormibacteraeota bacterium]|nr:sigma-70 family RNA polymerase sigma factor [Candidatus Dormibacteraeota bacterium]